MSQIHYLPLTPGFFAILVGQRVGIFLHCGTALRSRFFRRRPKKAIGTTRLPMLFGNAGGAVAAKGNARSAGIPSTCPMPAMEPVDPAGARPVNSPFGLGSRCLIVVLGRVPSGLPFGGLLSLFRGFWLTLGSLALFLTSSGAQEDLDRGKTPAQLYASGCATCHKSPQSVAKTNSIFGLESFLSEHYTTSREIGGPSGRLLERTGETLDGV